MMAELRQEIYDVLTGVSGLDSDNTYYLEADQNNGSVENTALPYVVFSEIIANADRIDTATNGFEVPVQVDFYGEKYGLTALESLYVLTKTALLLTSNYSFTGYNLLDLREDFSLPVQQDDVSQISMQINYSLEEL